MSLRIGCRTCVALGDNAIVDAIEIYIHRVRKKLDAVEEGRVSITTLRGLGYLLQAAA